MTTATVTSKGQVTIPASVRSAMNIEAGDRIEFIEVEAGRFEVTASTRSVKELKGMFGKARHTVSIEQMSRDISKRATSKRDGPVR